MCIGLPSHKLHTCVYISHVFLSLVLFSFSLQKSKFILYFFIGKIVLIHQTMSMKLYITTNKCNDFFKSIQHCTYNHKTFGFSFIYLCALPTLFFPCVILSIIPRWSLKKHVFFLNKIMGFTSFISRIYDNVWCSLLTLFAGL